jgi:hypothetical protein
MQMRQTRRRLLAGIDAVEPYTDLFPVSAI